MEAAIKSQDIPILLQVVLLGKNWKYEQLEQSLGIGKSALHRSLSRCTKAKLLSESQTQLFTANFLELLIHGVKYIFPANAGTIVRGVATAHSASPLNKSIISTTEIYVWPYHKGKLKGLAIEPLYKQAAELFATNQALYEMLCLIDAIRVGKAREVQIAGKLLNDLINNYAADFNQ